MTKTYFRLIEVASELRDETLAPAFATRSAAEEYRADILHDPKGLKFSIIETDEQGKPKRRPTPGHP
ncbi:MAG TPA: hypothetical protein VEV41_12565 [Terriglobales bacterium]|jgi:hypothetical protein|nr:hypothetical protein [Terriglobales bacterium]